MGEGVSHLPAPCLRPLLHAQDTVCSAVVPIATITSAFQWGFAHCVHTLGCVLVLAWTQLWVAVVAASVLYPIETEPLPECAFRAPLLLVVGVPIQRCTL